ncbi:hypothetical protein EMCRGX_G029382 [Ephydatia muelleri]
MGINPANQTEVWFEHRTADGRVYFSHPQTQKTTWDRPHDAQIISQPTVAPNTSAGASVVALSPLSMVGGAPQLVPARVWSEHQMPDSHIYYYNKVTRQSVWEKPKDFELVMPLPLNLAAIVGMENSLSLWLPGLVTAWSGHYGCLMVTWSGRLPGGVHYGWLPGVVTMVAWGGHYGCLEWSLWLPVIVTMVAWVVTMVAWGGHYGYLEWSLGCLGWPLWLPGVVTKVAWSGHYGCLEWSLRLLGVVTMVAWSGTDAQQPEQLAQATQLQAPTSAAQSNSSDAAKDQEAMVVGDHGDGDEEEEMDGEKEEEEKDEGGALLTQPSYLLLQPTLEQVVQTKETPPPPPPPAAPAETKPEPPRGPHPIASVAITGTPWCVVWTSDQKMFYFNAVKRLSMWSMPEELEDNPQVAKVIDEPPWGKSK